MTEPTPSYGKYKQKFCMDVLMTSLVYKDSCHSLFLALPITNLKNTELNWMSCSLYIFYAPKILPKEVSQVLRQQFSYNTLK